MGFALKIICLIVSFILITLSLGYFTEGQVSEAIYLSLVALVMIVLGDSTLKDGGTNG